MPRHSACAPRDHDCRSHANPRSLRVCPRTAPSERGSTCRPSRGRVRPLPERHRARAIEIPPAQAPPNALYPLPPTCRAVQSRRGRSSLPSAARAGGMASVGSGEPAVSLQERECMRRTSVRGTTIGMSYSPARGSRCSFTARPIVVREKMATTRRQACAQTGHWLQRLFGRAQTVAQFGCTRSQRPL